MKPDHHDDYNSNWQYEYKINDIAPNSTTLRIVRPPEFQKLCIDGHVSLSDRGLVTPFGDKGEGTGNGVLPTGTNPLPKPMLTNYQRSFGKLQRAKSPQTPKSPFCVMCLKIVLLKSTYALKRDILSETIEFAPSDLGHRKYRLLTHFTYMYHTNNCFSV